jgi:hypothetical protein
VSLPVDLLERNAVPFAWGTADCVTFACDAWEHITGHRPALPEYRDALEAEEIIAAAGSLESLVTQAVGEPVPVVEAEIGDIVLATFRATGEILGVADPPIFWLRKDSGFLPVDLDLALRVWKCRR